VFCCTTSRSTTWLIGCERLGQVMDPSIARSENGNMTSTRSSAKPWRCRLGLHHWDKLVNDAGEPYISCARCHKDGDRMGLVPLDGKNFPGAEY